MLKVYEINYEVLSDLVKTTTLTSNDRNVGSFELIRTCTRTAQHLVIETKRETTK